MKIGVDIDGVVCDLITTVCQRINDKYEVMYTPDDIQEWHQPLCINGLTLEQAVRDTLLDDNYRPRPYPDAWMGLKTLLYRRHSLVFITSRKDSADIKKTTALWCMMHSPPRVDIPIIHTNNKSEVPVDILIEDNIDTAKDFAETGRHVIVMVRPWNEKYAWDKDLYLSTPYIHFAKGWRRVIAEIDDL